MRSKQEMERKLRFWIDCLVEDMGELCNSALDEDSLIERRVNDSEFVEQLIEHLKKVIEYRKLSEIYADAKIESVRYVMYLNVSPKALRIAGPAKVRSNEGQAAFCYFLDTDFAYLATNNIIAKITNQKIISIIKLDTVYDMLSV